MANVISDETMEYVGILAKLELRMRKKNPHGRICRKCWIM